MSNHLRIATVAAAGVAALTLAACGSSDSSGGSGNSGNDGSNASSMPGMSMPATSGSSGSSSESSSSQQGAASGSPTTVTLTEFHIAMGSHSLKAGTYTFRVKNSGRITHALTVDGPGVDDKSTGDMSGGDTKTLTVTLKPGSYDFYCPVGNHKMEGMDETIKVS